MGRGKKRRRDDHSKSKSLASVNQFSHITGYDGSTSVDFSLDGCLAELQQSTKEGSKQISSDQLPPRQDDSSNNEATRGDADSSVLNRSNAETVDLETQQNPIANEQMDVDKVDSWNRNFVAWVKGSSYTRGMLPSVEEELQRNFKVKQLSAFLLQSGRDLRMPLFERWLIDSKLEDKMGDDRRPNDYDDPILPHKAKLKSPASLRLVEELWRSCNVSKQDAKQTVSDLCRRSNVAVQELASQAIRFHSQSPLKRGDRIEVEIKGSNETGEGSDSLFTGVETLTFLYSRKKWRKPFCFKLNKSHYNKLRQRFLDTHNRAPTKIVLASTVDSNCKATHAFHLLLLALLLRYCAMSGGQLLDDLRGGGMQGAIHEQVFEVLCKAMSTQNRFVEGFASPFNAYLPSFASAFPDIEWHFGSIGNFLTTPMIQGCFEANPPFSPGLMNCMVDHIEICLDRAVQQSSSLTFVVIVPSARAVSSSQDDTATVKRFASESFQRMISSTSCRLHMILRAREHGYIEGSQHLRPTRYKQSGYDTSVIILQSNQARESKLDEVKLKANISSAFASRHAEELSQRRKV